MACLSSWRYTVAAYVNPAFLEYPSTMKGDGLVLFFRTANGQIRGDPLMLKLGAGGDVSERHSYQADCSSVDVAVLNGFYGVTICFFN